MLPPVDAAVLHANPDFAKLYATLTTAVLNPDGSSRQRGPVHAQHATADRELRLRAAKTSLVTSALAAAVPPPAMAADARDAHTLRPQPSVSAMARRAARTTGRPLPTPTTPTTPTTRPIKDKKDKKDDLPPDLLDLLLLLPPLLSPDAMAGLAADDVQLLLASPPLSTLPAHLPRLATLVSGTLHAQALGLARVLNPGTNPAYLHRTVAGLPAQAVALQDQVTALQTDIADARQQCTATTLRFLQTQSAVLAALLRALEAKHGGPVARALELRAADAAVDAQLLGAVDVPQTLAQTVRAVYPPGTVDALQRYAQHLRDAHMRLDEAVREREVHLRQYGADDGDVQAMRDLARAYGDVGQQVQDVQCDLQRMGV